MEKRRPTYDLGAFQSAMTAPNGLAITKVAMMGALSIGFDHVGIVAVIATMERRHFLKSMTSHADHREWQDVYHVPAGDVTVYMKFRADVVTEFKVLSFKEKDE